MRDFNLEKPMLTTINLNEAKARLSGVVSHVSTLRVPVTILRYGKAVARIVPIVEERSLEPDPRLVGVSIADADLFDDCSTMFEVIGEK
jgi:antitoxin (DNA-binding transcriptional repressor) of toxin-antitoxin stability system